MAIEWQDEPKQSATPKPSIQWLSDEPPPPPKQPAQSKSWEETLYDSVTNFPESAGRIAGDVASAIAHPIDTVSGMADIVSGGIQNVLPKSVTDYINAKFPSKSAEEARAKADAFGKHFVDYYGSIDGFKKALGEDPAGVMLDAASVLSLGSSLATKTLGVKRPAKAKAPKLDVESERAFNQPRIDAAKLAVEKYGLSLDPVVSNPKMANTLRVTAAGQDHLLSLLRRQNEPRVAAILKKDIGIPNDVSLTSSSVFDKVREAAGGAKKQIQTISGFADDGTSVTKISALQPDALIGAKSSNKKVATLIADANRILSNPDITGARLISEIENLRKAARTIYKSTDIQPTQRIVADTYMGIANEFEALIERGLVTQGKTELLSQFRDGRVRMAKAYTLESATNLNTGIVDPMIIAKMTAKDNALTGAFADIGSLAGNFPESLGIKSGAPGGLKEMIPTRITRTGGGGTLGYIVGSLFGFPLVGAGIGAGTGEVLGSLYAKRLVTNPAVQKSVSIPSTKASMLGKLGPRRLAPSPAMTNYIYQANRPEEELIR